MRVVILLAILKTRNCHRNERNGLTFYGKYASGIRQSAQKRHNTSHSSLNSEAMSRNEELEHPEQYCIVELQVTRYHFTH